MNFNGLIARSKRKCCELPSLVRWLPCSSEAASPSPNWVGCRFPCHSSWRCLRSTQWPRSTSTKQKLNKRTYVAILILNALLKETQDAWSLWKHLMLQIAVLCRPDNCCVAVYHIGSQLFQVFAQLRVVICVDWCERNFSSLLKNLKRVHEVELSVGDRAVDS